MKKILVLAGVWAAAVIGASSAFADSSFNVGDLSSLTQDTVHSLVGTAAIGMSHHAYMPASSMGWLIGVDVGVEATGVRLPDDFRSSIATISQKNLSDVPAYIPVPKLNLHKGLPFGVDFGLSYLGYQDKFKVIGGDLKWAFTDLMKVIPFSAAVRLNYTSEKLWYLESSNFQTDLLISQNLLIVEPYVGAGLQFWSGHIDVPTNLPPSSGLPSTVSGSDSGTSAHIFAGLPFKLGVFHFTPEADYSTMKIVSAGLKFSFNF